MHRHSATLTSIVASFFLVAALAASSAQRIPAGTTIEVRNNATLDSGTARTGQQWTGTLADDLSVDGKVVAPKGSRVRGRISDAESSGRLQAPGILALEVTSVNGIPVTTDMYARDGEGHTRSNITKIGGGAAVGALLGGIFGGGRGAAIGAAAGGAAGTGVAAATGRREATIPAESSLTFKVQAPAASATKAPETKAP
jgi:hypothetical protein